MNNIKIELTHVELDALCLALNEAAISRDEKDTDLKLNRQIANAYETLRVKLRKQCPLTYSLDTLLNTKETENNEQRDNPEINL
jgi:hypothetical protein